MLPFTFAFAWNLEKMLDNSDTEELFHLKSRIKTQSDLIEEFIVIDNGREISLKKCEKEKLC